MKFNKITSIIILSSALLVTGCSQEDEPISAAEEALTITVTDGGFNGITRAAENGYSTDFSDGDACGLYIVRNGTIAVDNVKLTASEGADGSIVWQPSDGVILTGGLMGENYFLYYPFYVAMQVSFDLFVKRVRI